MRKKLSYLVKEKTRQTYSYDNLYQLIKVEGETTYNPYRSDMPEFVSNYSQDFTFDELGLGNMTSKVSKESVRPNKKIGDNLNYRFDYIYDENFAHRLVRAGERYYKYDSNGNIICEQDGSFDSNGDDTAYHKIEQETEDVYSTDYGWGLFKEDKTGSTTSRYRRTYTWNERNQLVSSVDANYSTAYVYGQDGQRSNKYTENSETLYFNKMWTHHTDSGNSIYGGQTSKNIYLGETRIVTKLNSGEDPTYQEEYYKQYYYHSDHLGSASMISDYKGDEYQRIEYTPYGETWVEKTSNTGLEYLPYKFTAKELDEETGLYYYGARYLDPRYSMWISTDPALGEYIPQAPVNDEIRKNNQNLPGMGGIFNHINGNLYHYAGNNPIRYIDPDGRQTDNSTEEKVTWTADEVLFMTGMQITFLNSGMTMMTGTATVIFSNGKESFEKEFEVISTYSEGIFCTIGESVSYTHYTKEFPANATKQDVIDSYEGIFQTESISFSLGSLFSAGGGKTYSVNSSTKEIDYTGWMGTTGAGGAGIGCEKLRFTLGAQVTAYRDPEKPNNNWEDHPEWFYNMPFIK